MKRTRSSLAVFACILSLAACSASAAGGEAEAGASPSAQGRTCAPAAVPAALPAVSALADSAALAGEAAGLGQAGFAVFTVGFTETGAPGRIAVLESDLPASAQAALATALPRRVRAQAPGAEWSVRLRVDAGAQPRFQVTRSQVCPPVLLRGATETRTEVRTVTSSELSQIDRENQARRRWRMELVVGPDGTVRSTRFVTNSGISEVDRDMEQIARTLRFRPGLRDGAPATTTFDLTAATLAR